MKLLKICKNRQEAEAIIQRLRSIKIVAVIKAVPVKDDSNLHLMVDEGDLRRAQECLGEA